MKRAMILTVVVLAAAAAAQAELATYAEITYPTQTTWRLWLTNCDWQGSTVGLTPTGYGIPSFNVEVSNVLTATKMTPALVTLTEPTGNTVGTVGFPNGPATAAVVGGVAQCFAGQDTTISEVVVRGFGVTAGSFVPPAGWSTSGPFSWDAPGAPGSANPGVLVFGGKRAAGEIVSINWARSNGKTFAYSSGVNTYALPLVPEPATLGLLLLGGLGVFKRRRFA